MEIWRKFEFTMREKEIYELAKAYENYNRKRGVYKKFLPTKTDPRNSKYWRYFEQAYSNFENDSQFDPYIFIEAQYRDLDSNKILYPAQLKTKTAVKKYEEHKENKKIIDETTETERILINLTDTYKFLRKWWKNNDLKKDDYESFFKIEEGELISDGMSYAMQGMISKYFLSVSKTFNKYYHRLDPDIKWEICRPKELESYRITLKINEEAWEFAKDIFGEEVR